MTLKTHVFNSAFVGCIGVSKLCGRTFRSLARQELKFQSLLFSKISTTAHSCWEIYGYELSIFLPIVSVSQLFELWTMTIERHYWPKWRVHAKKWAAHKEELRRGIDEVTKIGCKICQEQAGLCMWVNILNMVGRISARKREETSRRFSGQDWSRELPRADWGGRVSELRGFFGCSGRWEWKRGNSYLEWKDGRFDRLWLTWRVGFVCGQLTLERNGCMHSGGWWGVANRIGTLFGKTPFEHPLLIFLLGEYWP